MHDLAFEPTELDRSICARAAGAATFSPLFGREGGTRDFAAATRDARRDWRERVDGLFAAGWPASNPAVARRHLRNCPPFALRTADRARPCQRSFLCPFCHGRDVMKAVAHIQALLYGCPDDPEAGDAGPPEGVQLVSFRTVVRVTGTTGAGGRLDRQAWLAAVQRALGEETDLPTRGRVVGILRRQIRKGREVEALVQAADAAYVMYRVSFGDGERDLELHRGGLLLTRSPLPLGHHRAGVAAVLKDAGLKAPEPGARMTVRERPTPEALVGAAREAFPYPAAMLFRPADEVLAVARGVLARRDGPRGKVVGQTMLRLNTRWGPKTRGAYLDRLGTAASPATPIGLMA